MKKNLLTVGLLALTFSAQAQVLTHVDNTATFYVGEGALVYNGGGLQTKGSGVIDVHGNVMVVGAAGDFLRTLDGTSGNPLTTPGKNIILRLNTPTSYATSTYGQLYISGLAQGNISGFVSKEYLATKNGSMQQMALPFYQKSLSSLATDLGIASFANDRSTAAVGYWENQRPLMHNLTGDKNTLDKAPNDVQTVVNNNAGRYYAVGTANWNPSSPNAAAQLVSGGPVYSVTGVPFSDSVPISYTMTGAGYGGGSTPISYGVGNGNINNLVYNELYKSYLQDAFDLTSQGFFNATVGSESGTFGRNMYQFGNPFFTNIDLSTIGYNERTAGGDDGNSITSIQAVRFESIGVVTNGTGTHATSYKYITYNTDGTPAGDFKGAIVKPMQAFVIKLRNNASSQTINFNSMRRFAMVQRAKTGTVADNAYSVTGAKSATANGTLKQLAVIGLNSSGDEVMRTYFVVGPDAKTAHNSEAKLQAAAFSGKLNTREELPNGGEDMTYANQYWLYINEANQNDFQGKKVRMVTNTTDIKSYKFELSENATDLQAGQSTFVDGGLGFYIEQNTGVYQPISHNQILNTTTADAGLYYGLPNSIVLGTQNVSVVKDEFTIAFEPNTNTHQAIFPKTWKSANIRIYDLSGKLIFSKDKVKTAENFILPLTINGGYLVEAVSDTGVKSSKKVLK